MNKESLVSVIILNYNAGKLLLDCVESIKKSDYSNLEIKMKYFLPIRKEYKLDNLVEFIKDDCGIPNILNNPINITEYDMNYTNNEYDKIINEDIKEEISTLSRLGTLLKAILFPASFIQKSYFKKV